MCDSIALVELDEYNSVKREIENIVTAKSIKARDNGIMLIMLIES